MPQQTTVQFSITVAAGPLTITSPAPPDAQVDQAYSHQFTAAGGELPYSWAVIQGSLPPGITLSRDGLMAGTPRTPGVYQDIRVQVTDSG